MAKSRKKTGKSLKGGVGAAPAGRGGFADQLFQAREQGKTGKRATEYDSMPELPEELEPTPDNRFIENFQTVEDDLRAGMATNPNDPGKQKVLASIADSMTQMLDELPRETDPDMRTRMVEALKAYQNAWKSQTPKQQAAILSFVDPKRQAEFAKMYGRDAIVDYELGGQTQLPFMERTPSDATPGLRAGRAMEMDVRGDEDRYAALNQGRQGVRPYFDTERGNAQQRLLAGLIDNGVDPTDIQSAMLGDAALTPYSPAPGYILDRGDAPPDWMLSSYIGKENADRRAFRPLESEPNPMFIGRELRSQYDAIDRRGGVPVMQNLIGPPIEGTDVINLPTGRNGLDSYNQADYDANWQMKPEMRRNQEDLYQRAFGRQALTGELDNIMLSQEDAARHGDAFPLASLAPWSESQIQQVAPDGSIVHGDWTPEQVLATVFNQNRFLAESPQLRDAAFQRLLPQVAAALNARREAMGGASFGTQYNRNATGMGLLQEQGGNLSQPVPQAAPATPAGPSTQEIRDSLRRALEKRSGPQKNELGFSDPYNVPQYMASAMPNRLLSSLLG